MSSFFEDIKSGIELYFQFLQTRYGFSAFEERQIAYEYHFNAHDKEENCINIQFELTTMTPIWIRVNHVFLESLIEDEVLNTYNERLQRLYEKDFDKYLKTNNEKYIINTIEIYNVIGRDLNNQRLKLISEIINRDFYLLINASHTYKEAEKKAYQEERKFINSCDLSELKLLIATPNFIERFKLNEKLIIDTDKCMMEVYSIDELNGLIEDLSRLNINYIDWQFES